MPFPGGKTANPICSKKGRCPHRNGTVQGERFTSAAPSWRSGQITNALTVSCFRKMRGSPACASSGPRHSGRFERERSGETRNARTN
jgi:hypothetical protein